MKKHESNRTNQDNAINQPTIPDPSPLNALGSRKHMADYIDRLVQEILNKRARAVAEQYLTEKEVAERLRITPKALQAWRHRGSRDLKFCRFGSVVRYPLSAVIEFEQKNRCDAMNQETETPNSIELDKPSESEG